MKPQAGSSGRLAKVWHPIEGHQDSVRRDSLTYEPKIVFLNAQLNVCDGIDKLGQT